MVTTNNAEMYVGVIMIKINNVSIDAFPYFNSNDKIMKKTMILAVYFKTL
jgi:hypothetical protein